MSPRLCLLRQGIAGSLKVRIMPRGAFTSGAVCRTESVRSLRDAEDVAGREHDILGECATSDRHSITIVMRFNVAQMGDPNLFAFLERAPRKAEVCLLPSFSDLAFFARRLNVAESRRTAIG